MKIRLVALFVFFSLLLLFYPGESFFFTLFAQNKATILQKPVSHTIEVYPVPVVGSSPLSISAEGAYVLDLASVTPIYEKNIHEPLYPASTTKVVTALVAYDVYKPDQIVTVHNVEALGQVMGLVEGERITVENLLYGALVHSGNDAAYALANAYPGGFDKYIDLMNQKAKMLGMTQTHFKNPAGLDDPQQTTTPFDLSLASRELLKNPYLAKIVSTKEIIISDVDFKYFHTLTNVNQLLGEIAGIGGVKTGETDEAKQNLVSFYKHNGHNFLIVVLKSDDRFADTKTIVKWIDDNVTFSNISLRK
jgi:D-alanyl-D-alanine carboxypeptidase (penicillin-binding protein 5/6)